LLDGNEERSGQQGTYHEPTATIMRLRWRASSEFGGGHVVATTCRRCPALLSGVASLAISDNVCFIESEEKIEEETLKILVCSQVRNRKSRHGSDAQCQSCSS